MIRHVLLSLGWGTVKGITVALAAAAIGTTFVQSVVVAIISGTLGVIGMIAAAVIATRTARTTVQQEVVPKLDIVKEAVAPDEWTGSDRRKDQPS